MQLLLYYIQPGTISAHFQQVDTWALAPLAERGRCTKLRQDTFLAS